MLPFTRLILTALLFVIHVENAIPEADGASRRSLFIFHTGSYNRSGTTRLAKISLEKCAYSTYVFSSSNVIQTCPISRGKRCSVCRSTVNSNATARKESIANAIKSCKLFKGCIALNLDIERKAENNSKVSQGLTMYVEELARAIKQAGEQYLLIYDAAAAWL